MVRKGVVLFVALAICLAGFVLVPGLAGRLMNGYVAADEKTGWNSSLTPVEITIDPDDCDPTWQAATARFVRLCGDHIEMNQSGALVSDDGRTLTIREKGVYVLSGTLDNGQIVVEEMRGKAKIVLNGASVTCPYGSAIFSKDNKTIVAVAEGTKNFLSDGTEYPEIDREAPDAIHASAVYGEGDIFFCGTGELTVTGAARDGIYAKDHLGFVGTDLSVTAVEDGIVGHDALVFENTALTALCGMDCVKSNHLVPEKGYICINGGTYRLTSGHDAVSAAHRLWIRGGEFNVTAGGGYTAARPELYSAKGLKAGDELVIDNGTFWLDAADDAIHTDGALTVAGGTAYLSSADDAVAAADMRILYGIVQVFAGTKGLVAEQIEIAGGIVAVSTSGDGIRARSIIERDQPDDGSVIIPPPGVAETQRDVWVKISGGTVYVKADGDAVQSSGDFRVSGGYSLLMGPSFKGGDPMDVAGIFSVTGGTMVATGRPNFDPLLPYDEIATTVIFSFATQRQNDLRLTMCASNGRPMFSVLPTVPYNKVALYSTELLDDETYLLCAGGQIDDPDALLGMKQGDFDLTGDSPVARFTVADAYIFLESGTNVFRPTTYQELPIL